MIDYYNKHFAASATVGNKVGVSKSRGSGLVRLEMQYNPSSTPVVFDLGNRQIVEHLHFMLGQFLRETT